MASVRLIRWSVRVRREGKEVWRAALYELEKERRRFHSGWMADVYDLIKGTLEYKRMYQQGAAIEVCALDDGQLLAIARCIQREEKEGFEMALQSDSKHFILSHAFPMWASKRPLELLGMQTRESMALRKWLTSETMLEVVQGRCKRWLPGTPESSQKDCRHCWRFHKKRVRGDERHALSFQCNRCYNRKQDCYLSLLLLMNDHGVSSDAGDIWGLLPRLQELERPAFLSAWRLVAKCMKEIEEEILKGDSKRQAVAPRSKSGDG